MARQPDDNPSLQRRIAALEAAVSRLTSRSPFFGTGMEPNSDGGVQSTGFDGDLAAGNAGTKGWALGDVGAAFGALYLRPGSIGNESLTSPVVGDAKAVSATGFALTTTLTERAGVNITVPAGFTHLVGTFGAYVFSYNPNTTGGSNGTGGDAVYAQVRLGSAWSQANPLGLTGNGGFTTSSSGGGFEFTGLVPGATLRLAVYGASAYQGLAANVNNYANAFATLIWLR